MGGFLVFILIVIITICALNSSDTNNAHQRNNRVISTRDDYDDYSDDFDNIEQESFNNDDEIEDRENFSENSVYDRLQDGTYSKSDIDFLMEDDDLREDFFWFLSNVN